MIQLGDECIETAEERLSIDLSAFRAIPHIIIGTDNGECAIGVELHEHYVWVSFIYGDGKKSTHVEFAEIGKWLCRFYTIERGLPVLYTGDTNYYKNNSYQVADGIWQLTPLCYNLEL